MWKRLKIILLNTLFPPIDVSDVPVFQTLLCSVCRARLANNSKICHKNSLYRLGAATTYSGPVKNLIIKLKYGRKTAALNPLKDLLIRYLNAIGPLKQINEYQIIPLPLFPAKERQRGFNQAYLISKVVSDYYKIAVINNGLVKVRETPQQADAPDWDRRKKNVANSLMAANPALVKNKKIIVVDDVWTSGATMDEAARTLKEAGAKQIIGLVIARAG